MALKGRTQTPEHIAKRVAAVKAAYASWTEERRELWKSRISANTGSRRSEVRAKNSAAHKGKPAWCRGLKCPQWSGEKHWNWGKKLSPEHAERLRAANLGRKQTPELIAKRFAARAGYRHSEETKERIRQTNLKTYADPEIRAKHTGPNNPTWRGGLAASRDAQDLNSKTRLAIRSALKNGKAGQAWEKIVGYTLPMLMKRLKRTIPPTYAWDDFLAGRLHIDHIIPISVFNFQLATDLDFRRCWALNNLRLLPAEANWRKHAKLTAAFQPGLAFG